MAPHLERERGEREKHGFIIKVVLFASIFSRFLCPVSLFVCWKTVGEGKREKNLLPLSFSLYSLCLIFFDQIKKKKLIFCSGWDLKVYIYLRFGFQLGCGDWNQPTWIWCEGWRALLLGELLFHQILWAKCPCFLSIFFNHF